MVSLDATTVAMDLPSDVEAPRAARAVVRAALQAWGLERFCDVAELLTDELVSNVVRHVGSPLQLRVTRRPSAIRVEVDDLSIDRPARQYPQPFQGHGRGILLVESLASAWGVAMRKDGKTVWFEIEETMTTEG
jgi:anti-sigma regulatory factor (Ser/Thr protein kinase)